MKKILLLLLILILGMVGAGYWLVQDLNRLKPEIETFISEQAGVKVVINGDLGVNFWPQLQLRVRDIKAEYGTSNWALAALDLHVDTRSVLTHRQNFKLWQIDAVTFTDLRVDDESTTMTFKTLELRDYSLDSPGHLIATVQYQADDANPIDVDLDATIRYHIDTQAISLTEVKVATSDASGVCHVDIDPNLKPVQSIGATDEDLIPIETWQSFDWDGACDLSRIVLNDKEFNNVVFSFNNKAAKGDLRGEIPDFLGGSAVIDINISARRGVVEWEMRPVLTDVDAAMLMAWLNQTLDWKGSVMANGVFHMVGNSDEALAQSLVAEVKFDGGRGEINVSKIRNQILVLATLLNQADHIEKWPDAWHYQRFVGNWNIKNEAHELSFDLDDLNASGSGTYSYSTQQLDFLSFLMFRDDPEYSAFDVNPLLQGLPIPIRCKGLIDAPDCAMNQKDVERLIATALGKQGKSELRNKLDEAIEEKVPEEYKKAAKDLLDLLSGDKR